MRDINNVEQAVVGINTLAHASFGIPLDLILSQGPISPLASYAQFLSSPYFY
jgi:hypothetical protein